MKKSIIAFFLVFIMMAIPFASLAADYTSMSEEELYEQLNQIRSELENRKQDGEKIICQADGITIYFNSAEVKEEYNNSKTLCIKATATSTADKLTSIEIDKICINGWEIKTIESFELEAGKKAKTAFYFYYVDEKADIKALEDIEDIEFYMHSYDPEAHHRLTEGLHSIIKIK